MEKPDSIKPVKSGIKVTRVQSDEVRPIYHCKKCGSTSFKEVAASHAKFSGAGIKPATIRVCRNCGLADQVND